MGILIFMDYVNLKVMRLDSNAVLPKYQSKGAACFDLHMIDGKISINPGQREGVSTGLAFEVPPGHVMLVFPRSGQAFNSGLTLTNAVGVIDSDYRGELFVSLYNTSRGVLTYKTGDRIAQAMIVPIPLVGIFETNELSETERGSNGAGSTGL